MKIGSKIKELRIRNGLTLEELASRSELTKGFLSQLERDLTSPSISTLEDILEALGTNLSEFFHSTPEEQLTFGKNDFFVDERDEFNPVQIDNTDADFEFDNENAIVVNFKKKR